MDSQKVPFAQHQPAFADRIVSDALVRLGRALPCRVTAVAGQIVTVAFEVAAPLPSVTIPIATWLYDWIPVRVGDLGVTMPADARLGGISGLGAGMAGPQQPGNLTALMFVPCGNAGWSVPDAGQRVVQGPDGVLLRDLGAASSINITPSGITMISQGHTLILNSAGFSFDGVIFGTHVHDQPADSHGDTEAPTDGPKNP